MCLTYGSSPPVLVPLQLSVLLHKVPALRGNRQRCQLSVDAVLAKGLGQGSRSQPAPPPTLESTLAVELFPPNEERRPWTSHMMTPLRTCATRRLRGALAKAGSDDTPPRRWCRRKQEELLVNVQVPEHSYRPTRTRVEQLRSCAGPRGYASLESSCKRRRQDSPENGWDNGTVSNRQGPRGRPQHGGGRGGVERRTSMWPYVSILLHDKVKYIFKQAALD